MTSTGKVYIAGVGLSPTSSAKNAVTPLISAATKALLDAGITFDDVAQGVVGNDVKEGPAAFKAFDERGINIDKAKAGSEIDKAIRLVDDKSKQCVLVITTEKVC